MASAARRQIPWKVSISSSGFYNANADVGAVHPKAMPVILTSTEALEQWLTLPLKEALALQKPLPDDCRDG
jgi:putative SOS response-associated peptidase YedK